MTMQPYLCMTDTHVLIIAALTRTPLNLIIFLWREGFVNFSFRESARLGIDASTVTQAQGKGVVVEALETMVRARM